MPVAPERRLSGSSVTMPEDPMMKSLYPMWVPDMSNMAPMMGEPVYSAMTHSFSNMTAEDMGMAAPAPLLNPFDVSDLQQDWRADEEGFHGMMRMNDREMDEILADEPQDQMLLQQSASLLSAQYNMPSHILSSSGEYNCSFQSPTTTQQLALQGSPESSSFAPSPQHGPEQTCSRRGSDTSELASNLNTIRLQRVQQQISKEKPLGEPQLPTLNLAARRKKVPGALGAFANGSQSSIGPQTTSPSTQTIPHRPASSVRRIKSTGNSLNVVSSGRIQKSGAASAQRSPLNVATFAEAEAMNHINAFTAPSPSTSQGTSVNGTVPMTPHTPAPVEHPAIDWSKPLVHSTSIPNMHQHQQFHSSPYTTHAASPPMGTPYIQMPPRYMTDIYSMPPQSAPAHVTHFPDFSPEVHVMAGPSSSYFPQQPPAQQPPPHQPYAYQMGPSFVATQMSPVPMYHCQPQPQPQPQPQFYSYYQPHIMNNSPPPVFNPGYYAVHPTPPPPPAPVQELTWMPKTEFVGASPPPKETEAHRPRQYEFHYMGPQDF